MPNPKPTTNQNNNSMTYHNKQVLEVSSHCYTRYIEEKYKKNYAIYDTILTMNIILN